MSVTRIRFGIQTGQQFASWEEIVRIWQRAETLGYDTAWTYDHFVAVMMDPFDPCLESWSCLAALAVHTRRIRIGALVTGNTYRHPAILAKIATTVDVISRGRLEFGIGTGWYEPEHQMFGIPFGSARERCEPAVGRTVRVDDVDLGAMRGEPVAQCEEGAKALRSNVEAHERNAEALGRRRDRRFGRGNQGNAMAAVEEAARLAERADLLPAPAAGVLGVDDGKPLHCSTKFGS